MFENRGYAGEQMRRPATPVTWILLGLNAAVYVFQYYVLPLLIRDSFAGAKFDETFALSLDGLRSGHLWQLVTYQFLHGSFLHIFANSWAIYVFGQVVETSLGPRRMLTIYFLSGVMGGLLQMLGMWAWPALFGDGSVIGASAAAYGLVAAFVTLYPRQRLLMLLFFVIPISMRARTLLRVSVIFSLVGIFYPFMQDFVDSHLALGHYVDALFIGIGHAAHLGGIVTGVLLTLWIRRGMRMRSVVDIDPKSSLKITPASD